MNNVERRLGISSHNYENLLDGNADIGTASRLRITKDQLQRFLDGKSPLYSVACNLGILNSDLESLYAEIGKKGMIGLVIGFLLSKNKE